MASQEAISNAIDERLRVLLGQRISDMNRSDKQRAERLKDSSCIKMFHNHNPDTYRTKLKLKLLAKENK